jgi:PKD repeat protein
MTDAQSTPALTRRSTLAVLAGGGLGLAVANRTGAAQDASPAAANGSPLIGTWQWDASPGRPEPSALAIFHADGTYAEWQPAGGEATGIWRMNGERTFDLLFIFPDTDPSPDVSTFSPGTATFTVTGELDETGNALTAMGTIDVRDAGGLQLLELPWSRPATRVTFATNPSTGSIPATPNAGTPVG